MKYFTLCNSVDGPEWSKPVRERQMPYDSTLVESNEQTD